MFVQPTLPFAGAETGVASPARRRIELPKGVLLGIALVGFGVVFIGFGLGWDYFGFRVLGSFSNIATIFQIEFALSAAQNLFLNLGFFLILWGILRTLPRLDSWYWMGPVLLLAGGLLATAAALAQVALAPSIYPPASGGGLVGLFDAVYVVSIAGSVAETLGTVVALIAVARAAVAWRTMPGGPSGAGAA